MTIALHKLAANRGGDRVNAAQTELVRDRGRGDWVSRFVVSVIMNLCFIPCPPPVMATPQNFQGQMRLHDRVVARKSDERLQIPAHKRGDEKKDIARSVGFPMRNAQSECQERHAPHACGTTIIPEPTPRSTTGTTTVTPTTIREAAEADWPQVWALFRTVAEAGDVFAYDEHTTEAVARKLWFDPPATCFVAELEGQFAGTYYIRPNQPGRGNHVANAGYMVAPGYRGRGLARALCEHSLEAARGRGFTAMQFNFVVASNAGAVRVWEACGFAVVGRLPGVFRHRELGLVDALVMFRRL